MATKFKNLQQLLDFFKDEDTCKKYYEQQRWGGNVACPHCGSLKVYRTNRGFKCGEKLCNKKFSVTVKTIFENSKISLRTWFAALFLISSSKKGVSSLQLSAQLGITQKTAWFLLHRIREMLKESQQEPLTGMVEVDETYVGGKEKNKHENKKGKDIKAIVVGYIQREGKVRTHVILNTLVGTLQGAVKTNVSDKAVLITDGHVSYQGLAKHFHNHVIVKVEGDNYKTDSVFHTNNIEGYWSILKRGIYGIYHQVSKKHLQRYCDEFGYRFNTRKETSVGRFEDAIKSVDSTRLTYAQLVNTVDPYANMMQLKAFTEARQEEARKRLGLD